MFLYSMTNEHDKYFKFFCTRHLYFNEALLRRTLVRAEHVALIKHSLIFMKTFKACILLLNLILKFLLLIFTSLLFSYTNKGNKPILGNTSKDTFLKVISTGIPDLESITQLNNFAKKYGFKYYPIGGIVTTSRGDSILKENNSIYKILEERYGKNWKEEFDSQYDTISQIRSQASALINEQFPDNIRYFYYLVERTSEKGYYSVKIYTTDSLNGKSELIVHYKMTIALKQNQKAQITDCFEKLISPKK